MSKRTRDDFESNDETTPPKASPEEIISLLEGAPNASISNMTEHDIDVGLLQTALKLLYQKWSSAASSNHIDEIAAERFGVLDEFRRDELYPYGNSGLRNIMMRKQLCLLRLRYHAVRLGIMDLDDGHVTSDISGAETKAFLTRIHECLQRLYDSLMMSLLTRKCLDPVWASECPSAEDPYYIRAFDINKLNPNQQFLVFVLDQAQKLGLKRYRGACYAEIDSPPILIKGKPRSFKTHAWRKFTEIPEFVNRCAPKETHLNMWKIAVDGPAKNRAIEQLLKGFDMQFPDLEPNRHYHSFHNGIYDTINKKFYAYGSPTITQDIVSCKYHDRAFDENIMTYENWRDIPTPCFDRILQVQMEHVVHVEMGPANIPLKWSKNDAILENRRLQKFYELQLEQAREEKWSLEKIAEIKLRTVVQDTPIQNPECDLVMEWVYVFGGRILYPVNYIDTWQVMPMFVGRAGTGKSLILSTWAKFFDDADVATLANDVQTGFGLETVWDKFLWLIKEVKRDYSP